MAAETAIAIGAIVAAGAGVASTALQATRSAPGLPEPATLAPPPKAKTTPPFRSTETVDEEKKARKAAAQRQRQLQRQRESQSTVLTSPLGVVTPASSIKTSVLGGGR